MDENEYVERGSSKIEDSAAKDAAIQTQAEEKQKQKDKGICTWFALKDLFIKIRARTGVKLLLILYKFL